jgi:uncharacterized protein
MKKILLFLAILLSTLFSIQLTYAYGFNIEENSGHIALLTVSESSNNTEIGGIADLHLLVKPGTGRIFIDSFPLSKVDTQITTRFASEVACDLLEKDCSNYDFFYTITANSALVGGPSAGAAATVLTVAVLDNQKLDDTTVMTGTINSGNLIGPVAGVPAKAQAAQSKGYKRVLIPEWDVVNNTPSENLTIEVIHISTLENALYYFTGKNYSIKEEAPGNSVYAKEYTAIMSQVTLDLCTKYGQIINSTIVLPNLTAHGINITNSSQDNFVLAKDAINSKSYYSAASFCFSGNVKIRTALIQNLTNDELKILYATLLTNISDFKREQDKISGSLSTISELEAYMVVAERLTDASKALSTMNPENISAYQLAFANERFYTALIWSRFSKLSGQKFVMDKDLLRTVCNKKISEAEERLNYLELYYPKDEIRDDLITAYNYYNEQEYALCIFTASKVKADSDVVLSAIFVPEDNIVKLLDEKIAAAERIIAKQERTQVFPILGYSYYEYANSLKDKDKYSALIYAEYSLELSNLDMYFKKKDSLVISSNKLFDRRDLSVFILGLSLGVIITIVLATILYFIRNKSKKKLIKKRIK